MVSYFDALSQTMNENEAKQIILDELEKAMQTSADVWTFSVDVSDTETNIKSRLDYINETCNDIYNELV